MKPIPAECVQQISVAAVVRVCGRVSTLGDEII